MEELQIGLLPRPRRNFFTYNHWCKRCPLVRQQVIWLLTSFLFDFPMILWVANMGGLNEWVSSYHFNDVDLICSSSQPTSLQSQQKKLPSRAGYGFISCEAFPDKAWIPLNKPRNAARGFRWFVMFVGGLPGWFVPLGNVIGWDWDFLWNDLEPIKASSCHGEMWQELMYGWCMSLIVMSGEKICQICRAH